MEIKKRGHDDTLPAARLLASYLDLQEAVDYLIDETPEGVPLRDDADPCRLSDQQRSDRWKKRRRSALPLIVKNCAEGRWKATGKKPGSAVPEYIPDIHFNGSEINGCGDLMATPGPVPFRLSRRPGPKVVLWTELRFSVPDSADKGKGAELPEPEDPKSSAVRPNRAGREKGSGRYDSKDAPLVKEIRGLVKSKEPVGRWDAALAVADRAPGDGTLESRAKRLLIKYNKKYGRR